MQRRGRSCWKSRELWLQRSCADPSAFAVFLEGWFLVCTAFVLESCSQTPKYPFGGLFCHVPWCQPGICKCGHTVVVLK